MVTLCTLTRIVAFARLLLLNPHIAHAAPIGLPDEGSGFIDLKKFPDRYASSELNPPHWCHEPETRYEIHNTANSNVVIVKESDIKEEYEETFHGPERPSYEDFKREFLDDVKSKNPPRRNVNENWSDYSPFSPKYTVKGGSGDSHGKPAGKKAAISTDLERNMKSQNLPEKVELGQHKTHQDPKGLQDSEDAASGSKDRTGGNPQTGIAEGKTGVPGQPGGATPFSSNQAGSNEPDGENKKSPETVQKEIRNGGSTSDFGIITPPSPPPPSRESNQDSTDPLGSTENSDTSRTPIQVSSHPSSNYLPPLPSSQDANDKPVQVIDGKTYVTATQWGSSGEQPTLGNGPVCILQKGKLPHGSNQGLSSESDGWFHDGSQSPCEIDPR